MFFRQSQLRKLVTQKALRVLLKCKISPTAAHLYRPSFFLVRVYFPRDARHDGGRVIPRQVWTSRGGLYY